MAAPTTTEQQSHFATLVTRAYISASPTVRSYRTAVGEPYVAIDIDRDNALRMPARTAEQLRDDLTRILAEVTE